MVDARRQLGTSFFTSAMAVPLLTPGAGLPWISYASAPL